MLLYNFLQSVVQHCLLLKYFPKQRKGKYVGPLFKTQEFKGIYLSTCT